ncbi:hypothetical protein E2I00_016851 [Balaenoptera physalus]|uniref:Uncharacterized protein n=1 Tax=Balaenoptera physalus TaxID=9770 RepID=A0A643BMM7_BALPH|nr:hypothetical protein E2I00_016851 [Balaenoptera physalus]
MAADLMLVLVTTMGLGLARACPVPTTTRKGCGIGMFKSLLPSELKVWNCSSRLFPRTRDLKQLQEHATALEAELALTLKGPGDATSHTAPHPLQVPGLCECSGHRGHICGFGRMRPHPSVPSPVSHTTFLCSQYWLHRLQEAPEKVSDPGRGWLPGPWARRRLTPGQRGTTFSSLPQEFQDGLKASVTFILFHLLTWDLNCAARGDLCICELGPTPAHLGAQTLFMH